MKIELFEGKDGWRWRLRAANGEILATSEAYSSKDAAEETAEILEHGLLLGVGVSIVVV